MNRAPVALPDRHFTEDEIDLLAWARRSGRQLDADEPGWLISHVESCRSCRERVESRLEAMDAMQGIFFGIERRRSPDCPPPEIWQLAAAGVACSVELNHAAGCAWCGSLLRQAMSEVRMKETPEEMEAVMELPSSKPQMAGVIARRLVTNAPLTTPIISPNPDPPPAKGFGFWNLAFCVVGVAGVVIAFFAFNQWSNDPERLFRHYQASHRTLEWRFRDAEYAPLQMNRGVRQPEAAAPELLRLEAAITEGLAAHPNDPYWITAKSRLDLLAWRYDAALSGFRRVTELQPESAGALIDLAAAYFERGEATGHDVDFGVAIELLSQYLTKNPGDPVALFDRAVSLERMFLFNRAIADWEEFLRREPTGPWAAEARIRIAEAKKKINGH